MGASRRTPELLQQAADLRADGLTYPEIGERLGVDRTTARMWVVDPEGVQAARYQRDWRDKHRMMDNHNRRIRQPAETKRMRAYRYGLTVEELDTMLASSPTCASCGDALGDKSAIDHCHATGRIRGVLCHGCNLAIGHAKDDPARLRAMADYLTRKD